MVFIVPRLTLPVDANARMSSVASGSSAAQLGGEAVGGDDVEADPGQQRDPALLRLLVAAQHLLEDRDLAGDVQVVRAGRKAGLHHGPAGADERPGAVEHGRDPCPAAVASSPKMR